MERRLRPGCSLGSGFFAPSSTFTGHFRAEISNNGDYWVIEYLSKQVKDHSGIK
jgi:hypothetical protein